MFSWQDSAWNAWLPIPERLPHAILIRSAEGSGELEFAQGVAQSLLCENPRGDRRGCGACPACGWFARGNHPDFRLLLPDSMLPESQEEGAEPGRKEKRSEQIRIEQVRELAGFLAVGTHRAGLRVIVIYPADAMNANTQNALLKNLEEPPPETVFLLVSTQPDRLVPTARSRCMKFTLPLPDPGQVARWLKEQGVKQAAFAGPRGGPPAPRKAAPTKDEPLQTNRVCGIAVFGTNPLTS